MAANRPRNEIIDELNRCLDKVLTTKENVAVQMFLGAILGVLLDIRDQRNA